MFEPVPPSTLDEDCFKFDEANAWWQAKSRIVPTKRMQQVIK